MAVEKIDLGEIEDEDQVATLYATKGRKEIFIDTDEKIAIPSEIFIQLGPQSSKNIRVLMKHFFTKEQLITGSYSTLKKSHGDIISAIISNFYY